MIYEVGRSIYIHQGKSIERAQFYGLLGALFTLIAFGTTVFSYVRYYVFAPGYLCFPLFLYACHMIALGPRGSKEIESLFFRIGIIVVTVIVCGFFHKQEALLIAIFSTGFFGYQFGRILFHRWFISLNLVKTSSDWIQFNPKIAYWILTTMFVAFVLAGYLLIREGSWTVERPLWNNTLAIKSPWGWQGTIADPTGRVFETFGLFGLLIMALYLFCIRKRDPILFLSITCITPFLFLFNPVFVHYFTREVSHDTLWRISYMFPVGLVAAHVLIDLVQTGFMTWKSKIVVVSVLGISLLPLSGAENWQNNRWTTLFGPGEENDHRVWADLLEVLRTLEPANVLTDPVTGYLIRAITKHTVFGFKFHESPPYIPINYSGYGPTSFKGYESWLFIENQRDGGSSHNGRISGHWPEDIMKVSLKLGDGLISFLEKPPKHFRLLWERDGIRLYKISSQSI